MSDIDTAVVDSLKALDPDRPIREADMGSSELLPCKRPLNPMDRKSPGVIAPLRPRQRSLDCDVGRMQINA